MWLRLVRFWEVWLPGLAEWFFCILQTTVLGLCVMFLGALVRANRGGVSFSILSGVFLPSFIQYFLAQHQALVGRIGEGPPR